MPSQYNGQVSQRMTIVFAFCSCVAVGVLSTSAAMEQHMMQPRVPADKLAEARALTNPLPRSAELEAKGKALYEGKASCINCHGQNGAGDGPLAASLNPSPRNFHHHGFWRHRTEGELFWVIKYGVPGTAMVGFGVQLTDEEIWTIIEYERSFSGDHGERHGMRRQEQGGMDTGGCCTGQDGAR